VTCTAKALTTAAPSLEKEVRSRIGGFLGGLVRAYLPQTWVFRTEEDVASLVVEADGHVTVAPAALPDPDVTVELPHGELARMLAAHRERPPDPGRVKVTPHTTKGRTAFDYLRGRLGL